MFISQSMEFPKELIKYNCKIINQLRGSNEILDRTLEDKTSFSNELYKLFPYFHFKNDKMPFIKYLKSFIFLPKLDDNHNKKLNILIKPIQGLNLLNKFEYQNSVNLNKELSELNDQLNKIQNLQYSAKTNRRFKNLGENYKEIKYSIVEQKLTIKDVMEEDGFLLNEGLNVNKLKKGPLQNLLKSMRGDLRNSFYAAELPALAVLGGYYTLLRNKMLKDSDPTSLDSIILDSYAIFVATIVGLSMYAAITFDHKLRTTYSNFLPYKLVEKKVARLDKFLKYDYKK